MTEISSRRCRRRGLRPGFGGGGGTSWPIAGTPAKFAGTAGAPATSSSGLASAAGKPAGGAWSLWIVTQADVTNAGVCRHLGEQHRYELLTLRYYQRPDRCASSAGGRSAIMAAMASKHTRFRLFYGIGFTPWE